MVVLVIQLILFASTYFGKSTFYCFYLPNIASVASLDTKSADTLMLCLSYWRHLKNIMVLIKIWENKNTDKNTFKN